MSEEDKWHDSLAGVIVVCLIVFLIVITCGDPDILDGWIKAANK